MERCGGPRSHRTGRSRAPTAGATRLLLGLRREFHSGGDRTGQEAVHARLLGDQPILLRLQRRGSQRDEFQGGSVVLENQGPSEQDQGDLAPVGLPRRHTCGDECDRHHQLLALFEPTVPSFPRDAPGRRPPRPAQTRPTARNGSRYRHRATMLREARN